MKSSWAISDCWDWLPQQLARQTTAGSSGGRGPFVSSFLLWRAGILLCARLQQGDQFSKIELRKPSTWSQQGWLLEAAWPWELQLALMNSKTGLFGKISTHVGLRGRQVLTMGGWQ